MLLRSAIRSSFAHVKPLKIHGQAAGNGVNFTSETASYSIQIENPLEALIGSLAACKLATLRAISKNSNLKIKNVKFTKVQSELNIEKFMKGGPQNKLENITIEAQIETNVTQEEFDKWLPKVENSCPVYQMLKSSGVKIDSKWTNIQSL